eukprot:6121320-Heterocapsa_arctica.AAC.1
MSQDIRNSNVDMELRGATAPKMLEDLVAAAGAPAEADAGASTAPEGWGAKLLDLKGVARPPVFDGKPQSYSD